MTPTTTDQTDSLASKVLGLAALLGSDAVSPGALSQLRRLDVRAPDQPAFWSLLAARIDPEGSLPIEMESRWAAVFRGMARMRPRHHATGARVGEALAKAGYSEGRLTRLLRARGAAFLDAVVRACSFLASRGEPVDWVEFSALILSTDPEKAEARRRRVARDYFRALQHKEGNR
jgi:CRISPR system Cascade subunit CasB